MIMKLFPITLLLSYCDSLLVENAIYYNIPMVCIPSLKNQKLVTMIVQQQLGLSFPEGFWTESTVRDIVKQIEILRPGDGRSVVVEKVGWNSDIPKKAVVEEESFCENEWTFESYLLCILG